MSEDIHKYPSQLAERFQVRMPDGLRDRLRAAAEHNGRSMNSEIVARLEMSFGGKDPELPVAFEIMADQQRLILELADLAGVKMPRRLRSRLEELAEAPQSKSGKAE